MASAASWSRSPRASPRADMKCISSRHGIRRSRRRKVEDGVCVPLLSATRPCLAERLRLCGGAARRHRRCGRPRGPPRRWRWPPAGSRRGAWRPNGARRCMHGHWVIPGGVIAAAAAPALPLVVSLHGSDVFVAERTGRRAQRGRARAFHRAAGSRRAATTCGTRAIALGADAARSKRCPTASIPAVRARAPPRARDPCAALGTRRRTRHLRGRPPRPQEGIRIPDRRGLATLQPAMPSIRVLIAGAGDLR